MDTAPDPFEELTALYLGEPTPPEPPVEASGSASVRISVAVCGHLPVMAGLWVTQYADREAERHGPTGLVRLEGGRCSIELLRSGHRTARFDGQPMTEAVASLVDDVRRWIVCVDDRDAAAAVRAGAEEVVVLTSADRTALAEAFRLAKSAGARASNSSELELGVVVVGADDEASERARSVLAELSGRHLDRPIDVMATIRRIDVIDDSTRIAFDESLRSEVGDLVAAIGLAAERHEDPVPSPVEESSPGPGSLRFADHAEPGLDSDPTDSRPNSSEFEVFFGDEPEPTRPASGDWLESWRAPSRDQARTRRRPSGPIRLAPSPSRRSSDAGFIELAEIERDAAAGRSGPATGLEEPKPASADSGSPSASSGDDFFTESKPGDRLISSLGGLKLVDWVFPNAPGVDCGVDPEGRLHLACLDRDHGQLVVARQWASAQRRQLARLAGVEVTAVDAPVLHVLTTCPPDVADLHRTGIHLHLLLDLEGRRWSMPLNDDRTMSMPG